MLTTTTVLLLIAPLSWGALGEFPDYTQDDRLTKSVTLRYEIMPLNELMAELSAHTGVALSVSRDMAEDKVTVFVRNQPVRDLMTRMADLLQADWVYLQREKGYRLTPRASALRMEQAMRDAEDKSAQRSAMELLQRRGEVASVVDYIDLVRIVEELDKLQDATEQNPLGTESTVINFIQRVGSLDALRSMVGLENYLSGWIAHQFTSEHWQKLLSGQPIIASTHPTAGMIPLPERALLWNSRMWSMPDILGLEAVIQLGDGKDSIRITVTRFGEEEGKRTFKGSTIYEVWQNPYLREPGKGMENQPLIRHWSQWSTPSEKLDEILALQQKLRDDKPVRVERRSNITWEQRGITMAECLRWLAERTDLNILADAYRCGINADNFDRAGIPAYRWIREVLLPNGWVKAEGDWILVRHKGYWQLRHSEVPERYLRPLERKVAEGKRLELEDYAGLAAQLTPAQEERINTTRQHRFVVHFDEAPLRGNVPALRFWAVLTTPQRERARRGELLPFETLSTRQQNIFAQAYQFKRMRSGEQSDTDSDVPPHFRWQVEEREEYQAYSEGDSGWYSAKTLETLMETLELNQQTQQYTLYTRTLFRDIVLTFHADGTSVTYRISLRQVHRL